MPFMLLTVVGVFKRQQKSQMRVKPIELTYHQAETIMHKMRYTVMQLISAQKRKASEYYWIIEQTLLRVTSTETFLFHSICATRVQALKKTFVNYYYHIGEIGGISPGYVDLVASFLKIDFREYWRRCWFQLRTRTRLYCGTKKGYAIVLPSIDPSHIVPSDHHPFQRGGLFVCLFALTHQNEIRGWSFAVPTCSRDRISDTLSTSATTVQVDKSALCIIVGSGRLLLNRGAEIYSTATLFAPRQLTSSGERTLRGQLAQQYSHSTSSLSQRSHSSPGPEMPDGANNDRGRD